MPRLSAASNSDRPSKLERAKLWKARFVFALGLGAPIGILLVAEPVAAEPEMPDGEVYFAAQTPAEPSAEIQATPEAATLESVRMARLEGSATSIEAPPFTASPQGFFVSSTPVARETTAERIEDVASSNAAPATGSSAQGVDSLYNSAATNKNPFRAPDADFDFEWGEFENTVRPDKVEKIEKGFGGNVVSRTVTTFAQQEVKNTPASLSESSYLRSPGGRSATPTVEHHRITTKENYAAPKIDRIPPLATTQPFLTTILITYPNDDRNSKISETNQVRDTTYTSTFDDGYSAHSKVATLESGGSRLTTVEYAGDLKDGLEWQQLAFGVEPNSLETQAISSAKVVPAGPMHGIDYISKQYNPKVLAYYEQDFSLENPRLHSILEEYGFGFSLPTTVSPVHIHSSASTDHRRGSGWSRTVTTKSKDAMLDVAFDWARSRQQRFDPSDLHKPVWPKLRTETYLENDGPLPILGGLQHSNEIDMRGTVRMSFLDAQNQPIDVFYGNPLQISATSFTGHKVTLIRKFP